jgi:hypothetical protein
MGVPVDAMLCRHHRRRGFSCHPGHYVLGHSHGRVWRQERHLGVSAEAIALTVTPVLCGIG